MFVMRLNYSKARFVVAFPFQKQEAFFEGHIQAFHFFGGVPRRITYDNLKTAVFRILEGHHRQEQRAFTAFRSYYLFESNYCTPAQGHEKGGVESDVGYAQRNFFAPIPKAKDFAELNAVLHQACLNDMQRSVRGENRTVAEVWQSEKPSLLVIEAWRSEGMSRTATSLPATITAWKKLPSFPRSWHRSMIGMTYLLPIRPT
jgi:transposase